MKTWELFYWSGGILCMLILFVIPDELIFATTFAIGGGMLFISGLFYFAIETIRNDIKKLTDTVSPLIETEESNHKRGVGSKN